MTSDASPITREQKLKALRQIQFQIGQSKHPTGRSCGLTEAEFVIMANELLIEVRDCQDGPTVLDTHRIYKILPEGAAMLSQAFVAEPEPVRVIVSTPPKSFGRRIFEWMVNNIPGMILSAVFGGIVALFVAWIVWKHHWN